jgi:hypothetical protein
MAFDDLVPGSLGGSATADIDLAGNEIKDSTGAITLGPDGTPGLASTNDVYISQDLEVDGTAQFDGEVTIAGNLTVDTTTLTVNASLNTVGIGLAAISSSSLYIKGATNDNSASSLKAASNNGSTYCEMLNNGTLDVRSRIAVNSQLYLTSDATGQLYLQNAGLTGPGVLRCTRLVEANTAGSGTPNALETSEVRKLFTNEGTTAVNYHTLPTAAANLEYTFYVQDADGIRITANTGDTIRIAATVSSVAGYITSTTIGDSVTLVAINATEWVATSLVGAGWTAA